MSIRFAAIGFAHNHIYGQVDILRHAGATLVSYYDDSPKRIAAFAKVYPDAVQAPSIEAILEDPSIHVITSASIPNERAPLGIRAMLHGKDFLADKPGFTTFDQLTEARRIARETGRKYIVFFSERLHSAVTVRAGEIVHAGGIGKVIQTVGFGPHRLLGHIKRDDWCFDNQFFGGIINDLASHQIDQFLYFTSSTEAQIVTSQVANFKFAQFPKMDDFGDLIIRSPHATGYIRVDWLTPEGLPTWGDVRLFIQGTDGYIELRKNVDIAGREGANHLFIVDRAGTRHIDCSNVEYPFGKQFIHDVLNRTETAMTQAHSFLASELALQAQQQAIRLV